MYDNHRNHDDDHHYDDNPEVSTSQLKDIKEAHHPDSFDSDFHQNFALAGFFYGSSQTLPRPSMNKM